MQGREGRREGGYQKWGEQTEKRKHRLEVRESGRQKWGGRRAGEGETLAAGESKKRENGILGKEEEEDQDGEEGRGRHRCGSSHYPQH